MSDRSPYVERKPLCCNIVERLVVCREGGSESAKACQRRMATST